MDCPSCGGPLGAKATYCGCGWKADKRPVAGPGQIFRDKQCTYLANLERCQYPVGFYDHGATSGWCIFHRLSRDGATGAQIVSESFNPTKETKEKYLEAAAKTVYGNGDNVTVAKIRAGLRKVPLGNLKFNEVLREPGSDEEEAA